MTTYMNSHKERTHGVASQAGHFLRHLLEMILAMFVGMAVGGALALWMHYRGMDWGPISEMSGAMFVEVILLIGVVWVGIFPENRLILWQHVLMIPAMIVPMLYRRDLYTVGHHAHAH